MAIEVLTFVDYGLPMTEADAIELINDERENWLLLFGASLLKAWGNDVDDVFNELNGIGGKTI